MQAAGASHCLHLSSNSLTAGVRALAPNILGDSAITPEQYPGALQGFFAANPIPERLKQVEQIVAACSSSKVGLLGFCWGAKTCVLASGMQACGSVDVHLQSSCLCQQRKQGLDTSPMSQPRRAASWRQWPATTRPCSSRRTWRLQSLLSGSILLAQRTRW